jgi:hypothetical protein
MGLIAGVHVCGAFLREISSRRNWRNGKLEMREKRRDLILWHINAQLEAFD